MYIGGGEAVEARSFNYGLVRTKVKNRSWMKWAYLPKSLLKYAQGSGAVIPPCTAPNMQADNVKELQTRLNKMGF